MKKCPYCAEEIQDEAIVCRYCGRDLQAPTLPVGSINADPEPPKTEKADSLDRPLNGFVYFLIGWLAPVLGTALLVSLAYMPIMSADGIIVLLVFLQLAILYFASIGRYGKLSFFGVINILVWSVIPLLNWALAYYIGRGLHMKLSRQELHSPPNASAIGSVLLGLVVVVAWVSSVSNAQPSLVMPTPVPTHAPVPTATKAAPLWAQPTASQLGVPGCTWWFKISDSQFGEETCVQGIVDDVSGNSGTDGRTRIYFRNSDGASFYIVDDTYYYPDLRAGHCIYARGIIRITNQGEYFMSISGGLKGCAQT